jgi:hypothetical protein
MKIVGASSMSGSLAESRTKRDWWSNFENGFPSFVGFISGGWKSKPPDDLVNRDPP